ncbi:TspO/MBR family protein [Mycobacterium bourgelatii]|uniref:Tryptophan-rich sensory protein n=1 Tax=Mycobacterium bourgelatii TaxID=1273442 RepID=A0A7I9YLL8_MYCBU|nr:TspO/MBR family protein [Mycobacterium bourgelatii]MCV6978141.1 tryptophan-rich sensory protein [Mycobacterium bourgelatii]GFG89527.1 tryptophan-rich sensory protein [Mycobacterium bourgelatii]
MNSKTLAGTSLAVAAAATAGSIASPGRGGTPTWFARIRKPSYQPPSVTFPVVWTALYTDIAATSTVAIDRFRETGRPEKARGFITALGVNLILNAGWSWLFFRYHRLGASALGAAALTASSADLVKRAAEADPRAGAALSPYALWCGFATALSTHIWFLNR